MRLITRETPNEVENIDIAVARGVHESENKGGNKELNRDMCAQ